ncbi:MAG: LLM class flavin-dependent oxidoreductase [Egibacteraceae bacterium]
MRLNVMIEPQEGMTYADILAVARRTEELGLDGLFRSDHYKSVTGRDEHGSTDAWATLAGLARETNRIQLGTLVTPVTFRTAASLAKTVATISEMAGGGRVELGMGTGWLGWLESEHVQHGFPFEDLRTRYDRLEEHLQVVRGLWDPAVERFTFDGEFVTIRDGRFAPKPDPTPRIIVGGRGLDRTPTLAARYADELNGVYLSPPECAKQREALRAACDAAGRDPDTVGYSAMTGCLVDLDTEDFHARARRLQALSEDTRPLEAFLHDLEEAWVLGTPDQAAGRLAELAEAGVERVMLQHLLFDDLDMLDVIPQLPR